MWSASTSATMASTMGTARGTTQGSCRPRATRSVSSPSRLTCTRLGLSLEVLPHEALQTVSHRVRIPSQVRIPHMYSTACVPATPQDRKAVLNPDSHHTNHSCRSCGLRATTSPPRHAGQPRTVFCLRLMVLVGLNATLATMVSPLASPPWMPPELRADPKGFG